MMALRNLCTGVVMLTLAACGGGSGNGDPGADPFPPDGSPPNVGLEQREPLATLTLPGEPGTGTGVAIERAFANLTFAQPLFLAQVPGEARLVVVEQGGRIRAFEHDDSAASTTTVLDISERTTTVSEQGLLGLAFDPEFVSNRRMYVHYTLPPESGQRRSIIARFDWAGGDDAVDLATEKVILEIAQPHANHNAGMLAFGPDGMLYVGLGDGGSGGDPDDHGQNRATLLGSLLRLDVHPDDDTEAYRIPPDNPFVGVDGARDEIWAYGLRNPWRFSFDRDSGDLWLADVGQSAVEEINIIQRGGNYGWRIWEGRERFGSSAHASPDDDFEFPIHQYAHENGASITGGYVYRGSALPSIAGWYLYGDFVTGQVWALQFDGTDVVAVEEIGQVPNPSSFGEDAAGELYVVSYSHGTVHRLIELDPGSATPTPERLSQTGLFTDTTTLTPASGVLPYDVTLPQWANGARMRRWIAVPDGAVIGSRIEGPWQIPVGSVLVQHFEIATQEGAEPDRRLETRLLVHRASGWQGFTYRWDDHGRDATLLTGPETMPITISTPDGAETFSWRFPGRVDCQRCHTTAAGTALGIQLRQIFRDFDFPLATANQVDTWLHIGLISGFVSTAPPPVLAGYPRLDDADAPVSERARAWLSVNCAHCHRPDGPTALELDLRFETPPEAMNAWAVPIQSATFGIAADQIVAPGDAAASMLWHRLVTPGNGRMPPFMNERVDEDGATLVGEWIDGL
jgi:uncharacterized repeat protein (TIGR03806 family)